jgi:hypothetical protein
MIGHNVANVALCGSRRSRTENAEVGGDPFASAGQRQDEAPRCIWPARDSVAYRRSLLRDFSQIGRAYGLLAPGGMNV